MIALSRNCPGRGESHSRLCRCGQMVYFYRGYETTAQLRTYNVKDGLIHDCPALALPDTIECVCGAMIYRYEDGRRLDMTYQPHTCKQPKATPPPLRTAPATITPPKAAQPPRSHWRNVIPTETSHAGK